MLLRQWHTYIGAFIAPSVLFFALTGAIQLFSLHEAHDGYKPPVLLEKLASVHKDQVFRAKDDHHGDHDDTDHDRSDQAGAAKSKPADAAQVRIWVLKWLFVVVAVGLVGSTLIGLWLAFTTSKRKGVILLLLLVGAAAPVLLLAL